MKSLLRKNFPLAYAKLSRIASLLRRRRFAAREVVRTYDGFSLRVWLADAMGATWYDCDWAEMPELAILKKHRLRNGSLIFDLGGHHGVVAMILAKNVGETGRVIAVEADPFCAAVALKNKELNHIEQLEIVHAAVAELSGPLAAAGTPPHGSSVDRFLDWHDQGVLGVSLDALSARHGVPDVVMIDVDGFDCHALRGGTKTLAAMPDFFVEVHVGEGLELEGGSKEEVLNFFPQDRWDLLVAGQRQHVFFPYEPGLELLNERFFLIATPKIETSRQAS
jgi:FkbM family methyltransferase